MNVLTDCRIIWLDDRYINDEDLAINIQYYVIYSLDTFTDLAVCSSFLRYCTSEARLLLLVIRDHYIERDFQKILPLLPPNITVLSYVLYDQKYSFRWKTDTRIQDIFHVSEENKIVKKLQEDLQQNLIQRWSSGCGVFDTNPGDSIRPVNPVGNYRIRY